MQQQGFQPTTPENAERTIRVAYEADSYWISIEQGGLAVIGLNGMENILSQTGYPLVKLEIWDSDVCQMELFSAGQLVNQFSDWANYDQHPRRRIGNAALWAKVLPDGTAAQALKAAWTPDKADYPFESEGILDRVIDLLQIERWRLRLGREDNDIPSGVHVTELHFRFAQVRPYDQPLSGLPAFRLGSYAGGKRFDLRLRSDPDITFSVLNLGGESVGIEIEFRGDALDKTLIKPTGIVIETPFNSFNGKIVAVPERQTEADGTITFRFLLEEYAITAGIDWDAAYALPLPQRDFNREREFYYRHMFAVALKPHQSGKGRLTTRIVPLVNPAGAVEFTAEIEVER